MRSVLRYLDKQLAVDARSLAAGRAGIGLLLLYDTWGRAQDLRAHYTDAGVLPRSAFQMRDWSFVWSVHALAGNAGFEAVLLAAAAVAAIALTVGVATRAATVASFLLSLSIQGRNPLLHDGQDDLLRVVLFFSLWLPLGRVWSIDALRRRVRSAGTYVRGSLATGLALQLVVIYQSSAVGKLQSAWWLRGEGILRALTLGRYETAAGRWLSQFSGLLHGLSFGVVGLEAILPLLLFLPWRRQQLRLLAVALALGLHLGFAIFMRLSIFPALCIATWVVFVPGWVLDRCRPVAAPAEPPEERGSQGWPLVTAMVPLVIGSLYVVGTHRAEPILPDAVRRIVEAIGLQQYWVVFAPRHPETVTDGYFVAPGLRPDGSEVDLFAGDGPVTYQPPELVSSTFEDRRWRHWYANLVVEWIRGSAQWRQILAAREATGHWLCHAYAERHPEAPKLTRASLFFIEHSVERPEQGSHRRLIAQVACAE